MFRPVRRLIWPRSRQDWWIYALVWLTYALGWAALLWIRAGGPSWPIAGSAARIILPAALLGIGVLALCSRIDFVSSRSVRTTVPHLLACLAYPVLWIAAVSGSAALLRGISQGSWEWLFPPEHVWHWHFLSGVLIYITIAAVYYGQDSSMRAERSRERAEWQLLRAQLNPHFVFNTLHTLVALARTDALTSERGIDRFSRMLRFSLSVNREDREWVRLDEEWGFVRDYLLLEELRFGDRLRWKADLSPAALACAVPPIVLQPLIENALRFAVDPRPEGAHIAIAAQVEKGTLILKVTDDGPGCDAARVALSRGVGLRSIRARLAALASADGHLHIETAPGRGFVVTVALPAINENRAPQAAMAGVS